MDGKSIGKEQWIKLICVFLGSLFALLVYNPVRAFISQSLINWNLCPYVTHPDGTVFALSIDECILGVLDYPLMIATLIFLNIVGFLVIYSVVMYFRNRKRA